MLPPRTRNLQATLGAVLLVALITVGQSRPISAATPPKLQPYIIGLGRQMAVYSNSHWYESPAVAVHARQIKKYTADTTYGGDPAWFAWTRQCRPGRQAIRLQRTIELPGRPSDLRLKLWDENQLVVGNVELWFNGKRVHRSERANPFLVVLDAADRRMLHAGLNEIEVVAVKKPAPCRGFIGFYLGLEGYFSTDLWVGKGPPGSYQREPRSLNVIRFGNRGPSWIYDAEFTFSFHRGFWVDDAQTKKEFDVTHYHTEGRFVKGCTLTRDVEAVVHCELEDLAPGAVAELWVTITYTPRYVPFHEESVTFGYRIQQTDANLGPWELKYGDERANAWIVFCGTASSKPECTSLPP